VGNTGAVEMEITWIDRTQIEPKFHYNFATATSGSVIATISFNKTGVQVVNNGGATHYVFTENGEFMFTFRDVAGNTGEAKAKVDWIDNAVPTVAALTYSPDVLTSGSVEVRLTLNEKGKISEDWQKITED
jgi:hypothetical protein